MRWRSASSPPPEGTLVWAQRGILVPQLARFQDGAWRTASGEAMVYTRPNRWRPITTTYSNRNRAGSGALRRLDALFAELRG
jgi:hypothetical protein